MSDNLTIAIVSASGAVIVALASLIVNVIWMGRTFDQLDRRLIGVETDLKQFYREQSAHATDTALIKERLSMK